MGAPYDIPTDAEFDNGRTQDVRSSWVFVSHSAIDENVVTKVLGNYASQRFLTLHIANRSQSAPAILAYKARIVENLWRCSWFVVAVSKTALNSSWVRFEVRCALRSKSNNHLLCLLLDDSDPAMLHPGLSAIRAIDVRPLLTNRKNLRARLTRCRLGSLLPKGGLF
jgi:TIR domain